MEQITKIRKESLTLRRCDSELAQVALVRSSNRELQQHLGMHTLSQGDMVTIPLHEKEINLIVGSLFDMRLSTAKDLADFILDQRTTLHMVKKAQRRS